MGRVLRFPYQRRNRSCSPPKGYLPTQPESSLPRSPKVYTALSPKPHVDTKLSPVVAKSFVFGRSFNVSSDRQQSNQQVLTAITCNQQQDKDKEYILDDIPEDMPDLRVYSKSPREPGPALEAVQSVKPPPASTCSRPKSRHQRVVSQILDKQTLNRLLFPSNATNATNATPDASLD